MKNCAYILCTFIWDFNFIIIAGNKKGAEQVKKNTT